LPRQSPPSYTLSMNLSIVLLDGEKLNFQIKKDSCVIGRSAQCDVVITHDGMSRRHCMIEVRGGDIFVTDLGSSNGVSIEGQKIPVNTPVPYQSYLALSFGPVQSIVIDLEESKTERPKSESSSPTPTPKKSDTGRFKIEKTNSKTAVPAAKKESQSKMVKIAAFIAILGVLGYFLTKENDSNAPTPEQIYE
jgi:pSer/pThr/pTyr-binding forkhead associated (FHA) protein